MLELVLGSVPHWPCNHPWTWRAWLGDRLVLVVGEQPHKRCERARVVVVGSVHLDDPPHDVAHRVAIGVGCDPQHGGEELFGLTPPEAVGRAILASRSGEQLGGCESARQAASLTQRAPRR